MQHIARPLTKCIRLFHLDYTIMHNKLNNYADYGCTENTKHKYKLYQRHNSGNKEKLFLLVSHDTKRLKKTQGFNRHHIDNSSQLLAFLYCMYQMVNE